MKKVIFFAGFGFLPLWVAIAVVCLGSLRASAPFEYWAVAPWLIIFSVPVCVVTLVIALVTLVIYNRTPGNPSQKSKIAATSFLLCVLVVGAIAAALWVRH